MDAQTRDIIVIGASQGGIDALSELAAALPSDLAAAVLVVQHTSEDSPGLLAEILAMRGPLRARSAEPGMVPRHGEIYVAPPDRHLLLTPDGLSVVFGPRENRARPAIDPLFRTAAVHYGPRVIGVILTGLLADGSAGLLAVHRCGGCTLVQAPEDAAHPDMPAHALAIVPGARPVPLSSLAPLLADLCRERAPPAPPVPEILQIEVELTERAMSSSDWSVLPGRPTDFTCPDCRGAIRELDDDGIRRFRCRVGHAYSEDELVAAKDESVEQALWIALQTLQERVQMLTSLARTDRERGWARSATMYEERAREARLHASRLHEFVGRLARGTSRAS